MRNLTALLLSTLLVVPTFGQDNVTQATDFYDRVSEAQAKLIAQQLTPRDALNSYLKVQQEIRDIKRNRKYIRSGEVSILVTGAVAFLLAKKQFKNKWVNWMIALTTGTAVVGGEVYLYVKHEELDQLNIELNARKNQIIEDEVATELQLELYDQLIEELY